MRGGRGRRERRVKCTNESDGRLLRSPSLTPHRLAIRTRVVVKADAETTTSKVGHRVELWRRGGRWEVCDAVDSREFWQACSAFGLRAVANTPRK